MLLVAVKKSGFLHLFEEDLVWQQVKMGATKQQRSSKGESWLEWLHTQMGSFIDRHAKWFAMLGIFLSTDRFSKLFWRLELQVSYLRRTSTPGLAKWMCFTGRCSWLPPPCASWGKWAMGGCSRKQQPTVLSQVVLLPGAGHWDSALWLARWKPVARKQQRAATFCAGIT